MEVTGLRNPCKQLDGLQPGLMAADAGPRRGRRADPQGGRDGSRERRRRRAAGRLDRGGAAASAASGARACLTAAICARGPCCAARRATAPASAGSTCDPIIASNTRCRRSVAACPSRRPRRCRPARRSAASSRTCPVFWHTIRISRRSSIRSIRKSVFDVPTGPFVTWTYSSPSSKRCPLTSTTRGYHSGCRRGIAHQLPHRLHGRFDQACLRAARPR